MPHSSPLHPILSFDESPFLVIDNDAVSLGRSLRYLQLSGRLVPLIREIAAQHLIHRTLQQHDRQLAVSVAEFEGAIAQFRHEHQLVSPDRFEQWLDQQHLSYEVFQTRITLALKLEKLKAAIAAPNLEQAFQTQKEALTEAELRCIFGDKPTLTAIATALQREPSNWRPVVAAYEQAEPPQVSVVQGGIGMNQLPPHLRSPVSTAKLGAWVGPLPVGASDQQQVFIQVQQRHLPSLCDRTRRQLQDQLFQQWLNHQLDRITVALDTPIHAANPNEIVS
jgi:hypothetical protein